MKLHNILPEDRSKMDRLYDYIHDRPTDLTEDEKKILDRVSFADDQLRARKTDAMVMKLLKLKFPEISLSTARNDLITAKYVFNSLSILDKSYGLQLLLQMNLQMCDKAMLQGDAKNANALFKTRMELLKLIEETEEISIGKVTNNTYVLNIQLTGGRNKTIDLEKIHELPIEEHEELMTRIHTGMIPKDLVKMLQNKPQDE